MQVGNYNPMYNCEHVNAKGRVGDWIRVQPTEVSDTGMTWSLLRLTPYMDMLYSVRLSSSLCGVNDWH